MTNAIPALALIILIQPPTTNYLSPSGKEIEVGGTVIEKHVVIYTNLNGNSIVRTHWETNLVMTRRFVLQEKWVPTPMLPPPPLPHR